MSNKKNYNHLKKDIEKYEQIENIYYKEGRGYSEYKGKKVLRKMFIISAFIFILFAIILKTTSAMGIEDVLWVASYTAVTISSITGLLMYISIEVFNRTSILGGYKDKHKEYLYIGIKESEVTEEDGEGMRNIKLGYGKKMKKFSDIVFDKKIYRESINTIEDKVMIEGILNKEIQEKRIERVIEFIDRQEELLETIKTSRRNNIEAYRNGIQELYNRIKTL